jgi:hypothetical protein
VKTCRFKRGNPFCSTRKTIEKRGISVKKESPMQRADQKPFLKILIRDLLSVALSDPEVSPMVDVAVVIVLANSGN